MATKSAKTAASTARTSPTRTPSRRRMTAANTRTVITMVGTNSTTASVVSTMIETIRPGQPATAG